MKRFYVALLLLVSAVTTQAATLSGTVRDSKGAVIAKAHVVVHWDGAGSNYLGDNVGPVKSFFCFFSAFLSLFFFFEHTTAFTPKSGLPGPFFDRCFDDLGSLIIFRSTSVRPKHLFDPYFEP